MYHLQGQPRVKPRDVKLPESGNTRSDKTSIEDGPLPALDRARTGRTPEHCKALCQGIDRFKVYHFADREGGSAEPLRSVSTTDRKAVGFGIERPMDLSGPEGGMRFLGQLGQRSALCQKAQRGATDTGLALGMRAGGGGSGGLPAQMVRTTSSGTSRGRSGSAITIRCLRVSDRFCPSCGRICRKI